MAQAQTESGAGNSHGVSTRSGLFLQRTQVADIEPLRGLAALETLDLEYTRVANLAPVQELPTLRIHGLETLPRKEVDRFINYRRQHNFP